MGFIDDVREKTVRAEKSIRSEQRNSKARELLELRKAKQRSINYIKVVEFSLVKREVVKAANNGNYSLYYQVDRIETQGQRVPSESESAIAEAKMKTLSKLLREENFKVEEVIDGYISKYDNDGGCEEYVKTYSVKIKW